MWGSLKSFRDFLNQKTYWAQMYTFIKIIKAFELDSYGIFINNEY